MPRYEHDPSKVVSTLQVLPKGDYEFLIKGAKAFERTAGAGHQSYGVRYKMEVADGLQKGKPMIFTTYLHSEGAESMAKQFLIAAYGHEVNDVGEKAFDEDTSGDDWSIDTDSGKCGDAYEKIVGKRIANDLDVEMQHSKWIEGKPDTDSPKVERQVFGTWRPI